MPKLENSATIIYKYLTINNKKKDVTTILKILSSKTESDICNVNDFLL